MLTRGNKNGFALPAVLISSVIMLGVLMVSVTSAAAVRTALVNQYYEQLSQNASDAGIAYAKSCLDQSAGIPRWSDEKPLQPGTDCSGNQLAGFTCTPQPIDSRCSVATISSSDSTTAPVEVLLVGGGGGGGYAYYGGGGGGGQFLSTNYEVGVGSVSVAIGGGGAAGTSTTWRGASGGNTTFGSLTAIGGGGGGGGSLGTHTSYYSGGSGASGGGAAEQNTGGTGTAGNNGGTGGLGAWAGNGGGGAGSAGGGVPANYTGGSGGAGLSSDISGATLWYAGGGGGSGRDYIGNGGSGVGGNGAYSLTAATAGMANRGGGGGGARTAAAAAGGSGVVVVRYQTGKLSATGGTVTTSGSYTIHTFTSNGTFQVTNVVGRITHRSTFKVGLPQTDINGRAVLIKSEGDLQLLKTSTGDIWRSYKSNAIYKSQYVNPVNKGLVVDLDASNSNSYSTAGCPGTIPGTWTDLSGNQNNGFLQNGVGCTSSDGGALTFDGTNDYVQIGALGSFYDQGTIDFWMKSAVLDNNYRHPFGTRISGTNWDSGIEFESSNTSATFYVMVGNDSDNYTMGTYLDSGLTADVWYHVTLTWDKVNGSIKGYLNGARKFSLANSLWPARFNEVVLGTGDDNSAAAHWKGSIASFRIYNRSLSPTEVQQYYNFTKSRYN